MLNDQVDRDEPETLPAGLDPKRPPGRPTLYNQTYHCKWARKLSLAGFTNDTMAEFFGVATSTVELWMQTHPEFSGAVRQGKDEADARVAQSLYKKAIGYYKETEKATAKGDVVTVREFYPPDTASAIFWLKNRRKADWRDRSEQDLNVKHSLSSEFEGFIRQLHAHRDVKVIEHVESDSNVSREIPSEYPASGHE